MNLAGVVGESARRIGLEARSLAVLKRAGAVGSESPQRLVQTLSALRSFGAFGAAPRIAALRFGELPAVADELGEISYVEPARPGRIVLLTSGTTGTPKGAPRPDPRSLTIPGAVLERMPMRARETTVVAPPLFHGTGLLIALLTISLGSKLVLRKRFDPAQFLDEIEQHRATGVCVVPVMLQRVLGLGDEKIRKRDLSSLRVIFCAGSQLPAEVALKTMDLLGEVIYNLYGSTEVSVVTLATPEDIRAAPTSVGKPALGARVKILDEKDNELPRGQSGRVDGRDDEMIVSGGENVFPREVEELLITHPAVADVAVIGVEDAEFGQRLKAFVVTRDSESLTADEVREFVKENLARYKVPRDVVCVDELPRNPTGKILKRELAAQGA